MPERPYDKVALIYNHLMRDVDYKSWSKYILKIADYNSKNCKYVLELAAGNGRISEYLSAKFNNFIATDISLTMLKASASSEIIKICCDMKTLPFKTKFDFIFSAFDSINYILTQRDLIKLFSSIKNVLNENGIFTFDASLEKNSLNFVIPKISDGTYNGYSYKKINHYKKLSRKHINEFLIQDKSGVEVKEVHEQKIYKLNTYFRLADKAGLQIKACYNCFSFDDVNVNSERVQFVLRNNTTQ
jgi:SAM-dependent methyltransferase